MAKKLLPINRISLHYKEPIEKTLPVITNSKEVVQHLKKELEMDYLYEKTSWIMLLNDDYEALGLAQIELMNPFDSVERIVKIFQLLLLSDTKRYVLIDYCPNGNLSMNDHQMDLKLQLEYLEGILSFKLLDYILVKSGDHWSFTEDSWKN